MIANTVDADVCLARRWAEFYRGRGYNPLPTRPDAKRPFVRYSEYWEAPAPKALFDRYASPSLQIMTGRRWQLLVIDLDGLEARTKFETLGQCPRTWATHSGGNGVHLWFRLPPNLGTEIPKAILWRGKGEHSAIERLCDHSLVMVPPSIHPRTGRRYQFMDKSQSPAAMPLPAMCPSWILGLKPVESPRPVVAAMPQRPATVPSIKGRWQAADVLDAICDKVALSETWGLRVASRRPNSAGWVSCHAVGREDRSPSASISAISGRYWEPGTRPISLFDLGVRLGVYLSFADAVNDLGARFRVREAG